MKHSYPKHISKYQIKSVLGQGAMGIVYLGYDKQIDRKVAIKTISVSAEEASSHHQYAVRFVQEAKLLAKCNHPNIVTILEFGKQGQMAFMVMEYINGPSLKEQLKGNKTLTTPQVMTMFVQLLKALHAAHQNDIIHRDLKPENILIEGTNNLKLTDFGIAKSNEQQNMTQIGVAVGTPKYMAPEQMFGSDEVGTYTDIYSLFVILFELLGHVKDSKQYDGTSLPHINQLAKHNQFQSNTSVPVVLHEFIHKGLSVGFKDRFATIPDVVKAFKPILHQLKLKTANTAEVAMAEDTTSGFFTTGTVITQSTSDWVIDDHSFAEMRAHLAELIGPMADFILTHALKQSHSQDQFIMAIAEKLDNQSIRETFIDRWRAY